MDRSRFGSAVILGIVALALMLVGACGNSSITGTDQDSRYGSVMGKVSFAGADDYGGIIVTLERITGGMTAKVAAYRYGAGKITSMDSGNMQTATNEEGVYVFDSVPFGEYSLTAGKSDRNLAKTIRITVASFEPVVTDVVLTATANAAGTVLLEDVADNSGILVYIEGTSYLAITDEKGAYRISDVPLGTYEIHASASEYTPATATVSLQKAGADAAVPVITLRKTGSIMGRVLSAHSDGVLGGVAVSTLSGQSAVSNENGVFTISNVPAGSALLLFAKNGYDMAWVNATPIKSGELTTLPGAVKMYVSGTTPPEDESVFNKGYTSVYCRIEGVSGDAAADGMKGLINVYDIKHSIAVDISSRDSSRGATPSHHSPIIITKHVDRTSPTLMEACSSGKHYREVNLYFFKIGPAGAPIKYYEIILKDVLITGITSRNFLESRQYQNIEEVSLDYAQIEVLYYDDNGQLVDKTGWNVITNTPVTKAIRNMSSAPNVPVTAAAIPSGAGDRHRKLWK